MRMLAVLVALIPLALPAQACVTSTPRDFLACWEAAMTGDDVDLYASLLADDYTESYLGAVTTSPIGRPEALENWLRLRDNAQIASIRMSIGGDLSVTEMAPGVVRIDGITTAFTAVAASSSNGGSPESTVKNWASFYLRSTEGGYKLYRADLWTHDPSEK